MVDQHNVEVAGNRLQKVGRANVVDTRPAVSRRMIVGEQKLIGAKFKRSSEEHSSTEPYLSIVAESNGLIAQVAAMSVNINRMKPLVFVRAEYRPQIFVEQGIVHPDRRPFQLLANGLDGESARRLEDPAGFCDLAFILQCGIGAERPAESAKPFDQAFSQARRPLTHEGIEEVRHELYLPNRLRRFRCAQVPPARSAI